MIKYEYKSPILCQEMYLHCITAFYMYSFNLRKVVKMYSPKTYNLTLFRLLAAHENKK